IDVRQRVRRGDPAEGIGVVHDRREEVGRGHDGPVRADPDHGRVIAVLNSDEQVCVPALGDQAGHHLLEFAWRDLASTAATAGVLGEPDDCRAGHVSTLMTPHRTGSTGTAGSAARLVLPVPGTTVAGGQPALRGRGETITWEQAREEALQLAAGFIALGLQPGERVALMLPNRVEHVLADFGALHA